MFTELWLLYLLIAVACGAYALINQVIRMKRMLKGNHQDFGKGLVSFAIAGFVGSVFFLLFLVSFIWQLVRG